jgi:uncharacterized membrane protein
MNYCFERTAATLKHVLRNPATFFLCMAALFGIIICFRLPPITGTDEFTHFPRVYQISDGKLWEQKLPQQQYGGVIPQNVNNMVNDYRDLSRKGDPQEFTARTKQLNAYYTAQNQPGQPATAVFTSVATYPPWAYVPSVVGLLVAKVLHTPLIWYVYLARLSTLLVWVVLVWTAIKLLPAGKWYLTVIALLPTSLSQATTIGGDGLLTGLSWLTIALVLAVFAKKIRLNWTWLTLLCMASIYVAAIKVGYWLLGLLPLIIPTSYFKNRKVAFFWKLVLAALIICSGILFARHNTDIANNTVLTPRLGVYINARLQEHYVLHHALQFVVQALSQFFTKEYDTVYLGIVGILTQRLIYLPIIVIGVLYAALITSLARSEPVPALSKHRRLLVSSFLLAFLGTCLFISLAFYIANTQVGSQIIFGIYGRYYLPILPLLLVIPLTKQKEAVAKDYYLFILPIFSMIGLLYTLFAINH